MKLNRRTFLIGTVGIATHPWRFIQDQPQVKVQQGTLQGYTENGVNIFKGIPFATPPVNYLRFKIAQPPKPWSGTREATKNAPAAMQSGNGDSEDCLYLNIFAPQEPGYYPVLFWIHGGGNTGGGTNGQGPGSFVKNGIIVVTVAYRLGSFGYLPLHHLLGDEYASSGVNGIQDLVAALRWVKANIEVFGGDANRVTIAGQSAGAKNVAALMATPNAKNLFSRAIMHSGSGLTVHSPQDGLEVTTQFLNANKLNPQDLLKLTANELLKAQGKFSDDYLKNYPFRPSVGTEFLPQIPAENIQSNIPLIIGTCHDESLSFIDRTSVAAPINSRAVSHATSIPMSEIDELYRRNFPDLSDLDRRIRVLTGEEYWIPSIRHAEAHSKNGAKTWMYRFEHKNEEGYAPHGAEMGHTWNPSQGWTLHETWSEFIKGKSPKIWPLYNSDDRQTLIYGQNGKTVVHSDPSSAERMIWSNLL